MCEEHKSSLHQILLLVGFIGYQGSSVNKCHCQVLDFVTLNPLLDKICVNSNCQSSKNIFLVFYLHKKNLNEGNMGAPPFGRCKWTGIWPTELKKNLTCECSQEKSIKGKMLPYHEHKPLVHVFLHSHTL